MEDDDERVDDPRVVPLEKGLLTLSTLPKSHWSNLQNMDIIKVQWGWDLKMCPY